MAKRDKGTEENILKAARKAFIKKGLSGARMQDIANEAGINKALVHYYFESKEKLFALVFGQEFEKFFSNLASVLTADLPLFDKIRQIVQLDVERLSEFPEMPLFVLNEINRNPAMIVKRLKHLPVKDVIAGFQQQVNHEVQKGVIRNISAMQLLINIQSMSIFPFVAKPMLRNVLKMSEKDYQAMMEQRKTQIAGFVISAISN